MKFSATQLLLAGAGLSAALPHMDSPQQRYLNGMNMPAKYLKSASSSGGSRPYTPGHRDPYDNFVDPDKEDLDPLPWRNGEGATVLGPYNRDRSRQSPDLVRPPSTDHGNVANMRWSFADSHTRIEVSKNWREKDHTRQRKGRKLTMSLLPFVGRRLDKTDDRPRTPHQYRAGWRQHAPRLGRHP